jgi:hypothetical protein
MIGEVLLYIRNIGEVFFRLSSRYFLVIARRKMSVDILFRIRSRGECSRIIAPKPVPGDFLQKLDRILLKFIKFEDRIEV